MKIGLIVAPREQKEYRTNYETILNYLVKKGHKVVHLLKLTEDELMAKPIEEREKLLKNFYNGLKKVDLTIAECSQVSTNVGYCIAHILHHGHPLIILYMKGSKGLELGIKELVSSFEEFMSIHEYIPETIKETIDLGMQIIKPKLDTRFTIIFPPDVMTKLREISHNKKMPKAVYIRQLIEKELKREGIKH